MTDIWFVERGVRSKDSIIKVSGGGDETARTSIMLGIFNPFYKRAGWLNWWKLIG